MISKKKLQKDIFDSIPQFQNYFATNPLDRRANERKDDKKLKEWSQLPETVFYVLHSAKFLVENVSKSPLKLKSEVIFQLGESWKEKLENLYKIFLGFHENRPHFALDVTTIVSDVPHSPVVSN